MLNIVRMHPEHVQAVAYIERLSFSAPWSELMFYADLASPEICRYYVGLISNDIVGYIGMHYANENAHITTFAVHPNYRYRGFGVAILAHLLREAIRLGVKNVTLEVRVSNERARRLYAAFGFEEHELREDYYIDNHEAAIVLWVRDIDTSEYKAKLAELESGRADELRS